MSTSAQIDGRGGSEDRGPLASRVLLVEDDENTRRVLVLLLQLRGYEVYETGEPREGVRIAEEEGVALVISDLQLPGMSGIELAGAIARRDGPPPMIAITSGSAELVEKAVACGHFARVLRKPVDVNELLEVTARLVVSPEDSPDAP